MAKTVGLDGLSRFLYNCDNRYVIKEKKIEPDNILYYELKTDDGWETEWDKINEYLITNKIEYKEHVKGDDGKHKIIFNLPIATIEYGMFTGNIWLTAIIIPDGVSNIEHEAFSGCSSLTSITIPDSVTLIGDSAFAGVSGKLIINSNTIVSQNYGYYDEGDAYGYENYWFNANKFSEIIIGNDVKTIGDAAFAGCSSLTNITIPDSVTSIGDLAFYQCTSLTSITIPDSVTKIGNQTFFGCSSPVKMIVHNNFNGNSFPSISTVNNIMFGKNVNKVSFIGDVNITNAFILNDSAVLELDEYLTLTIANLYIPETIIDEYNNSDTWKEFNKDSIPFIEQIILDKVF